MPKQAANGRNVKSGVEAARDGAVDGHERAKDFPSEGEVARLLDATKGGRVSTANFAKGQAELALLGLNVKEGWPPR